MHREALWLNHKYEISRTRELSTKMLKAKIVVLRCHKEAWDYGFVFFIVKQPPLEMKMYIESVKVCFPLCVVTFANFLPLLATGDKIKSLH